MKNKIPVRLILILLVILFLMENLVLAYDNSQNKYPILGLRLNSQNLTGLDASRIKEAINNEVSKSQPLSFRYNNQTFTFTRQEIGAAADADLLTKKILQMGREGSPWQKLVTQNLALLGFARQKPTVDISQTLLNLKLLQIQDAVNRDALPIMPDFKGDINKTLPARDGVKINTGKITDIIVDNILSAGQTPFDLPVIKTFTTHNEDELVPIRKQAMELVKQPISISSGGVVFTLNPDDLKSMLTVIERPDPQNPKKLALVLRLDDVALNRKLGEFAKKVEDITHAEFDDHDARVAIYFQFYSGKRKTIAIPTGRNLAAAKVLGTETGGPKIAYLTFDDGPNSIYHPMILDILKVYNVKATFFLVGQNAKKDFDVARRTYIEGHNIGNHSNTHPFLPNLSTAAIFKELQFTNTILKQVDDNKDISLFRPPYGGVNFYVKKYAGDLGMKLFLWDVDPRDWAEPSTDELVRRVVTAVSSGADILLHSNHLVTVKALPKIIETLRSQGYQFEKLGM